MKLLSAFNPHELPEARLRAVATGRNSELAQILETIRQNLSGSTMQHLIASAPRGFGKSFLMRHIELDCARIAAESTGTLAVVLMPEEMPHVKEPETLLREITRTFAGGRGEDAQLSWHEDDGEAWESAVHGLDQALADTLGQTGMLVALVENFDVLLKRALPREEQRLRLRNWLTRPQTRVMLIAASASGAFDRSYDEPLFHAFREVPLEPWSEDDCLAYFDRQRADAGKAPMGKLPSARARAVATFIGGTPRLATLLGDALFDDDMLRAADLLTKMTDELTPYYKERIEALPGRAQKLLDALLRFGEPATQSELARRVNANAQSAIAGPFADLVRERVVTGDKAPKSSEILYRVSDRIFAHYYRRRVIDHGGEGKCPLEGLVDLLARYYSKDEKLDRAERFAQLGHHAEARVMARLHDVDSGTDARSRQWILRDLANHFIPRLLPLASPAIQPVLKEIAALARQADTDGAFRVTVQTRTTDLAGSDSVVLLLVRSRLEAAAGVAGGLAAAREAALLASQPEHRHLLPLVMSQESRSLGQLDRYEEALEAATRAEALAEQAGDKLGQARALYYAAWSQGHLGRHELAVETAIRSAALAQQTDDASAQASALCEAAWSLVQLGRHELAVEAAIHAAALAEQADDASMQAMALRHAAVILCQLGRHEQAVQASIRGVTVADRTADAAEICWAYGIAAISFAYVGRTADAVRAWAVAAGSQAAKYYPDWATTVSSVIASLLADPTHDIAATHAWLAALAELDKDDAALEWAESLLIAAAERWAGWVTDAAQLSAILEALEMHLGQRFAAARRLLSACRDYHAAGRDPAVLARFDPDVAKTIVTLHPPLLRAPS